VNPALIPVSLKPVQAVFAIVSLKAVAGQLKIGITHAIPLAMLCVPVRGSEPLNTVICPVARHERNTAR